MRLPHSALPNPNWATLLKLFATVVTSLLLVFVVVPLEQAKKSNFEMPETP